ncbi:MAG: ACT domain-containing protein [Candidatus Thermoplasmatota archaeon]|nr:ACT domain-containing protein [Candidatus Thermoplasmatota archaeon]
MTHYDIIQIKEDGKIEFPQESAFDIGIAEGAYFLLEASPEVKELRLERIALSDKELVEIEFVVENKPGVLSNISSILADHGVNILFNESEEVSETQAVLVTVIDVSNMDFSLEELEDRLGEREEVKEISIKKVD